MKQGHNSAPTEQNISPLGLYIHIPFCVQKCRYCDFYSVTDSSLQQPFIDAVCTDIRNQSARQEAADTIYFGGGTPSVLGPSAIDAIIHAIHDSYRITPNAEITLEVNPGTVLKEDLNAYRAIGINRINIGIQSFSDEDLVFLGRCHTSHEALQTLQWARESNFSLGIDLIYGLPDQHHRNWEANLEKAVSFHPEHISCYMLTYESGTPLDKLRCSGDIQPMRDSDLADFFSSTSEFLCNAGYDHYEISNFAKTASFRSQHNQKYWHHLPYIGFGPAAHSFKWPTRSWNVKSVQDYITRIEQDLSPMEGEETLIQNQLMMEAIFLGLRTKEGVSLLNFEKNFQKKATTLFSSIIEEFTQQELLRVENPWMALTKQGMLFHDHISARFTEAI
jgi:putative oxygen-independent coproporphyrinogen III oxidase